MAEAEYYEDNQLGEWDTTATTLGEAYTAGYSAYQAPADEEEVAAEEEEVYDEEEHYRERAGVVIRSHEDEEVEYYDHDESGGVGSTIHHSSDKAMEVMGTSEAEVKRLEEEKKAAQEAAHAAEEAAKWEKRKCPFMSYDGYNISTVELYFTDLGYYTDVTHVDKYYENDNDGLYYLDRNPEEQGYKRFNTSTQKFGPFTIGSKKIFLDFNGEIVEEIAA